MAKQQLIIDCDTGVDDAVALLLAFASPEFDILGVCTTDGNVSAELVARNTRIIRQIARREDVPVHIGCPRPIVRDPVQAGHFHGESGLGDLEIFEPLAPAADGHAVNFIIDQVMRLPPESVTLAVTGPMTNLAVAMVMEPRIIERLGPVIIMGGARSEGGNIIASAEFNVFADPHAAQVVFTSGCPITVLGLDATHQVRATPDRIAAIEALGTEVPGSRDVSSASPPGSRRNTWRARTRRCMTRAPSPSSCGPSCSPPGPAPCWWRPGRR